MTYVDLLRSVPIGSALVTCEDHVWIKVGRDKWVRPNDGASLTRKRESAWFAELEPRLIWVKPNEEEVQR